MSGGGGDSKVVQSNEPWDRQKGYLGDTYQMAWDIYANNTPQYFQGDTVANLNDQQTYALQRQWDRAANGSPLIDSATGAASFFGSGQGFGTTPSLSNSNLTSAAQGNSWSNSPSMWWDIGQTGGDIRTAGNAFADTARGDYLSSGNPYVNAMIEGAAGDITQRYQTATAPTIDSQMASMGRYGSGAHQNLSARAMEGLAKELGTMEAGIRGQAYSQERGLQEAAKGQLLESAKAGTAAQLSGLSGLDKATQEAYGRMFDAAKIQDAARQQEADLMSKAWVVSPELAKQDYVDTAAMAEVGQTLQNQQQREIDAARAKFEWEQMLPYNEFGWYQGAITGNTPGSLYTSTQSLPGVTPLGGVLGGAALGLTQGNMTNALLGAGLGGAFSLWG